MNRSTSCRLPGEKPAWYADWLRAEAIQSALARTSSSSEVTDRSCLLPLTTPWSSASSSPMACAQTVVRTPGTGRRRRLTVAMPKVGKKRDPGAVRDLTGADEFNQVGGVEELGAAPAVLEADAGAGSPVWRKIRLAIEKDTRTARLVVAVYAATVTALCGPGRRGSIAVRDRKARGRRWDLPPGELPQVIQSHPLSEEVIARTAARSHQTKWARVLQCGFVIYPAGSSVARRRQWLRRAVAWWCLRQVDQRSNLATDRAGGWKAAASRWRCRCQEVQLRTW